MYNLHDRARVRQLLEERAQSAKRRRAAKRNVEGEPEPVIDPAVMIEARELDPLTPITPADASSASPPKAARRRKHAAGIEAAVVAVSIAPSEPTSGDRSHAVAPTLGPAMLSVAGVQARLGIGRTAAYELMGRLPHVRIGTSIRVEPHILEQYIRAGGDETEQAWRTSSSVATSGGARTETSEEPDTASRPRRGTKAWRERLLGSSSATTSKRGGDRRR